MNVFPIHKHANLRKLILLGDIRQLPSIGPGNFLQDVFKSLKVKNNQFRLIFILSYMSFVTFYEIIFSEIFWKANFELTEMLCKLELEMENWDLTMCEWCTFQAFIWLLLFFYVIWFILLFCDIVNKNMSFHDMFMIHCFASKIPIFILINMWYVIRVLISYFYINVMYKQASHFNILSG